MTSRDQSRNLVAALSYLFGFVTGVVIIFVEPDDKFIRFHAMQSIFATGGLFILNIVVGVVLSPLGFLSYISDLVGILIWIVILTLCVTSFIWAYQGKLFKWPIAGNLAEKRVG